MRFVFAGTCLGLALVLVAPGQSPAQVASEEANRISHVLDVLHDAASKADFERYFDVYAGNAIFLGTDATERWTRSEFMEYAKPHFDRRVGWTYVLIERHVYVSEDGATAWFDERLYNSSLGETRGSGVLIRQDGEWKVAQYNLTIPIPNVLAAKVVEQIRSSSEESGGEESTSEE
ncbi:MAG: nuclear transport factor 2 family protein [Gemmatimonadota bacterium]